MSDSVEDFVHRRNIERLIELIYDTADDVRRRTLISLLAAEERAIPGAKPKRVA